MTRQNIYPKVSLDLYWVQITWTFWFLGIYLFVNIVRLIFNMGADSFFSGAYIASNIYMLIIGIISINFLSYYVENGITRKDYFLGNTIASFGLSITIPVLTYFISLIEKLVTNNMSQAKLIEDTLSEVIMDLDGHIIGEIVVSFILTPLINLEENIFLSLSLFSLNLLVFYLAGWLISAAFYRLGVIAGLLSIAVAIVIVAIKDSMVRLTIDMPLFKTFQALDIVPKEFALPVVALTILITVILIRLLTKRATVKI